jgi:hypothetical protein
MSDQGNTSGQLENLQRQWQEFAEAMTRPWQEIAEAMARPWQDLPRAFSPDSNVGFSNVGQDVVNSMVTTFEAFLEQQRAFADSIQKAVEPAAEQARQATEQFISGLASMLRGGDRNS